MASNIRVAIELDNRKYLSDIKAADSATQTFGRNASKSMTSVEDSTNNLLYKFSGLKTAIAGLGILTAVGNINQLSLSMQQASTATGISIDSIAKFSKAVGAAGGNAEMAVGDVIDFVAGLKEAQQGSASAQIELAKVGISLSDLGKLSKQQQFDTAVKGLAAIEDAATRNSLALKLLGKNFKDIDIRTVAAGMDSGKSVNTGAILAGAQAQQALLENLNNLKTALTNLSEPLNKIAAAVNISSDQWEKFIKILLTLGGVLVLLTKGVSLLTSFGNVVRNIGGITASAGGAFMAMGKSFEYVVTNIGRAIFTITGLGAATGVLVSRYSAVQSLGFALFNLLKGLLRFTAIAGVIYTVVESLSLIEKFFTKTDYIDSFFAMLAKGLENFASLMGRIPGIGVPFKFLANKIEEDRQAELMKNYKPRRDPNAVEAGPAQAVVDAFRAQRLELDKIVIAYKHQNDLSYDQLNFQTSIIGKTEEEQDKKTKLFEFEQRYREQLYAIESRAAELRKAAAVGTDEEKATYAAYAAAQGAAMAKITSEYESQRVALSNLIDRNQGALAIEKNRLQQLENMTAAMEAQLKIQEALSGAKLTIIGQKQDVAFEGSKTGKGSLQKQMMDIAESNRKAGLEASRAFAAAFEEGGDGLTPERARQLQSGLDAIAQGYKDIADAQTANLSASREWSNGWKEAFATYAEDAANAAEQSKTYFDTFAKGFEDAIVKFVQTGKLSFKDLANSLIAEFARIQAKKLLAGAFDMGGGSGGGGFSLGTFFSSVGKLFGFANGGQIPTNGPVVVGERGPELLTGARGLNVIPNNMLNMNSQQPQQVTTNVTYQIQAVDASSFRTLLARDPEFLYNVTQQGRRSMPTGSR